MRQGESRFRVRYVESDQMGVVHHSNYIIWFEQGRTDYMREIGVDYADVEREGIFLPVAELHIRYGAPARYGDEVRVLTRVERVQSRAVTFAYEVFRGDSDELLASGYTRLVAMDASGVARRLPDSIIARFADVAHVRAS